MIKKSEKKKIILILFLILVVVGMAIGYAALAQQLNVAGTAKLANDWNIEIVRAERIGGSNSIDNPNTPSFESTRATFDVDLLVPGATAVYKIAIKNNGRIPAKLSNIKGIQEANKKAPVELQFSTDANVNDALLAGKTIEYTVTVTWNLNVTEIPETKTKVAVIEFEYVQNT